jgi:phosphoglycolate phosphatase-like HAD superfamily hydrolase
MRNYECPGGLTLIRTAVFDLDGTLWPPQVIVLPAYRKVFAELLLSCPPDAVLLETLGHQFDVIWEKVMPGATVAQKKKATELMALAEVEMLNTIPAKPFPGVRETLVSLRDKGVELYILSNCEKEYLFTVPDKIGIGELFTGRYCAEHYPGLSKSQILTEILPSLSQPAVMVGDRYHDMEAGRENGLTTIACLFGFGAPEELAQADYQAQSFAEVGEILDRLVNKKHKTKA